MHEASLVADLVREAERVAASVGAPRVTGLTVTVGALSHLSADHLRGHFTLAARGTTLEDAVLSVEVSEDRAERNAQELELTSISVPEVS